MCRNSRERFVLKKVTTTGQVATAAPSGDHTDGSWSITDVYPGELLVNTTDGTISFVRDDGTVFEVKTQDADYAEYVAIVNQSGTSAPTVNIIKDTIGGITWGYNAVGEYTADTDAGSLITSGNYGVIVGSFDSINDRGIMYRLDDNTLRLDTFVSGVATNGVLTDTLIHIRVILP